MTGTHQIRLAVNGAEHELRVEDRRTLADMLRHDLGYTGTNVGCEHGICGACTVRLNGAPVRSCLVFGVQADGAEVRTVEGLAGDGELSDLQQAFRDQHALQCGFCTPGFLMLAEAYFAERGLGRPAVPGQPPAGAGEEPSEAEIREVVASNLCRCTGYQGIVAAMLATARSRRAAQTAGGPVPGIRR